MRQDFILYLQYISGFRIEDWGKAEQSSLVPVILVRGRKENSSRQTITGISLGT